MPGIHLSAAIHKLSIDPTVKPVKQNRRRFNLKKVEVIQCEVDKLLEVGFIEEVRYLQWVASVVLVKKKNGK